MIMAIAYFIPNGPKNLAILFPGIDFNNVDRYYLEVLDSVGAVVATTVINHIAGCDDDDYKYRIHFLNSAGAIDAINFKLLKQEHETKSEAYEKPLNYPLDRPAHGLGRTNVRSNDTFMLCNVDYTENDKEWLDELLDSPAAWIEWKGSQGQDDSYVPVIIVDKTFDKVTEADRFNYQVTIEIKLSHEKFTIRN